MFGTGWQTGQPDPASPFRGEMLRARKSPSVTELLDRRIESISLRIVANKEEDTELLLGACTLGKILGEWDARGGVRALARQVGAARGFAARRDRTLFTGSAVRCVADLTLWRVAGGDSAALGEYAAWVVTLTPDDTSWYLNETFAPLWQSAGNPVIERAADKLFGDRRSPWSNPHSKSWSFTSMLEVPMVRLRAFRKLVASELENHAKVGRVEVSEGGRFNYAVDDGGSGLASIDANDPHPPAPGTRLDLRACDWVASNLKGLDGAPAFRMYWPQAARDEALARMLALLRKR
jgi:hypothetical protein